LTKDDIRVIVLRFYYELNERTPGGMEQTDLVSRAIKLEPTVVSEAQLYLLDKAFLYSKTASQPLHGGYSTFLARITARGIEFIEHPRDFVDKDVPPALISVVSAGNISGVTIAGRDQQVVQGSVSGALAQNGAAASSTLPPFPIERLRELLGDEPTALMAVEQIADESRAVTPRWGIVVAAAETIKNVGVVGEATHLISSWLSNPAIPEWTQHAIHALLDS
jgi:hypothetical protein